MRVRLRKSVRLPLPKSVGSIATGFRSCFPCSGITAQFLRACPEPPGDFRTIPGLRHRHALCCSSWRRDDARLQRGSDDGTFGSEPHTASRRPRGQARCRFREDRQPIGLGRAAVRAGRRGVRGAASIYGVRIPAPREHDGCEVQPAGGHDGCEVQPGGRAHRESGRAHRRSEGTSAAWKDTSAGSSARSISSIDIIKP